MGATFIVTLAGTTLQHRDRTASTPPTALRRPAPTTPPASGSLSFAPGEKTKTITVTVLDDAAAESVEEFSVVLGDPVNATITKARGFASIEASDRSLDPTPTIVRRRPTRPTGTPQIGQAGIARSCRG